MRKGIIIVSLIFLFIPFAGDAAAQAPITQEEVEAILERDQVKEVSSSSLPADLKRRLGQTIASTSDAMKPALTDTLNQAERAIATATEKISSTSEKIKKNLDNISAQAKTDLSNTFLSKITEALSSAWRAVANWFLGFFRAKPLVGANRQ